MEVRQDRRARDRSLPRQATARTSARGPHRIRFGAGFAGLGAAARSAPRREDGAQLPRRRVPQQEGSFRLFIHLASPSGRKSKIDRNGLDLNQTCLPLKVRRVASIDHSTETDYRAIHPVTIHRKLKFPKGGTSAPTAVVPDHRHNKGDTASEAGHMSPFESIAEVLCSTASLPLWTLSGNQPE